MIAPFRSKGPLTPSFSLTSISALRSGFRVAEPVQTKTFLVEKLCNVHLYLNCVLQNCSRHESLVAGVLCCTPTAPRYDKHRGIGFLVCIHFEVQKDEKHSQDQLVELVHPFRRNPSAKELIANPEEHVFSLWHSTAGLFEGKNGREKNLRTVHERVWGCGTQRISVELSASDHTRILHALIVCLL